MKRIFTALFCLAASIVMAADLFVQEFGGGGTYPNITDAIAAASAGDRILVSPKAGNAPYIENLAINKDLQLLTASNGALFLLQGNITISTSLPAGSHVVIDGLRVTSGNISAGNSTNNIAVSIVNAVLNDGIISLGTKINATIANTNISTTTTSDYAITFAKGKVLGNILSVVTYGISVISDAASLDTNYIVGNRITLSYDLSSSTMRGINWANNSQFFYISNNYIYSSSTTAGTTAIFSLILISGYKSGSNSNEFNNIINNTLRYAVSSSYSTSYNFAGINASSSLNNRVNIFNNLIMFPVSSPTSRRAFSINGTPQISYNILVGSSVLNSGSATVDASNFTSIITAYAVSTDGCVTSTAQQNNGHPDPIFTDLDLTRNDIGACGGSYNITTNFRTSGTTGSAKVHWLQAPRRVLQGGTLDIKAEGHDR